MTPVTFDQILSKLREIFAPLSNELEAFEWLVINRDLYGRVRLIAPLLAREDNARQATLKKLSCSIAEKLAPHCYTADNIVLYESERNTVLQDVSSFQFGEFENVWVVDRLAIEGNWALIEDEQNGCPRVVFFSIKGGVGRSTALAATAWWLAQAGKRVLVLDMDLESPGLSTALLPNDRRPTYGIIDWLVEDLLDNGESVFDAMCAKSDLSHDGEIYIVPAHGVDAGEYIAKLGRVWMPKISQDGKRENWQNRLRRLMDNLENKIKPDVILIDSRAGIDEIAAGCITALGANLVLLFALEGTQTWSSYNILFRYWLQYGVSEKIRERLQLVGAMIPEIEKNEYLKGLRQNAYDLFADSFYDDIPAGEPIGERFNFEESDNNAPHSPWEVNWHRGFAGLRSLHGRLAEIDSDSIRSIFAGLLGGITRTISLE